ncbi:Protein LURP-one-related 15 [Apostasia shenzhenica]|uniref:Protein LURP-one-related 15 n=1 Tax=Apostasia shenzhenica TaxID=1088818 RepID=A0A2I0BC59_9ASPA|nr:Protein LURP-one-related 15 [Apostasia shenzhenica]
MVNIPPPAASSSGAVINPLFCVGYPLDLAFTTKAPGDKSGQLSTVDSSGNTIFRAKRLAWSGFTQLVDLAGHPVVTMKAKFRTMHDRWQVFAGESTEPKDLLFSLKRTSTFQLHDEWVVFLAANTKEEECDFKITGSYRKKNYSIYRGNSSLAVAQMIKEHKLAGLSLGKHAYGASISPNCDYAFVCALAAIFHELNSGDPQTLGAVAAVAAGQAAGAAAGAAAG